MIGIDIPISRFEAFAPLNQLGPLGKSFAVNENGFLIFHPSLWTVSNYLEDPAHNDLEDIEGDSQAISSLRKAMIDLATGQEAITNQVQRVTIPDSSVILNEGHSKSLNMTFYFTAVPKTRFALAVVLPEFWQYLQVPEQIDASDVLARMLEQDLVVLTNRKYCDETKADEDEDPESIEELLVKLRQGACHGRDLNHLIWDYKILENMNMNLNSFVLTDGGLRQSTISQLRQDSVLLLDAYNSSLYKLATMSATPVVYVQKFVDRHIVPTYVHSSHLEDDDDIIGNVQLLSNWCQFCTLGGKTNLSAF